MKRTTDTNIITKLTVVIPCYNEEKTLLKCVENLRKIADEKLELEIIIVDDASSDQSYMLAKKLEATFLEISVFRHKKNKGKGAALRTGFAKATGDFVAIQDADLEYDPMELKKLLSPLIDNKADVVLGSRFLSCGMHRVLYFWHYVGNRLLTLISNIFTDLNLTDMETCYKVFRREVIQGIDFKENRFGFEPEVIAKIAQKRLRIYETGISYHGRTYEEGKKIGFKDAIRALYCVFHYNLPKAPIPIQFLIYLFIGGTAAIVNLTIFLWLFSLGMKVTIATPTAFFIAALVNYYLSIAILFRHKARWNSFLEVLTYILVVLIVGFIDLKLTQLFLYFDITPGKAKLMATILGLILNFSGRRFIVFPEKPSGKWKK